MSRQIIFSMIGAGAMLIGSASDASAFEMFGRMLGGGCCGPEPACGCAVEPSCGLASSCCDAGCGHRRGLFHGLFQRHHRGCEPACGCAAEPVCGCPVEPACGCAAGPGYGGGSSCCDPCGGRRHRGLLDGLFSRHRGGGCCEPACGYAAAPVCGCAG